MVKAVFCPDVKEETETKVEKYDWNAVKNALDDSARKFLVSQANFEEDHSLMNGRLVISTITVLFSLYGILYDWYHPFPESRTTIIVCVAAYFLSIGVLTLYTAFVEKACFAAATQKNEKGKANKWKLSSKQKADSTGIYEFEVEVTDGASGKSKAATYECKVSKFFDENGKLLTKAFYADLARYCAAVCSEEKKGK